MVQERERKVWDEAGTSRQCGAFSSVQGGEAGRLSSGDTEVDKETGH